MGFFKKTESSQVSADKVMFTAGEIKKRSQERHVRENVSLNTVETKNYIVTVDDHAFRVDFKVIDYEIDDEGRPVTGGRNLSKYVLADAMQKILEAFVFDGPDTPRDKRLRNI